LRFRANKESKEVVEKGKKIAEPQIIKFSDWRPLFALSLGGNPGTGYANARNQQDELLSSNIMDAREKLRKTESLDCHCQGRLI
jgi:hypothetical protein